MKSVLGWMEWRRYSTEERDLADAFRGLSLQ